jgi:hypothetical protein
MGQPQTRRREDPIANREQKPKQAARFVGKDSGTMIATIHGPE